MKTQTIKLKNVNMLCHRCVTNVVRSLSQVEGMKELHVDLKTHQIKFVYINHSVSKEMVIALVKESIEGVKVIRRVRTGGIDASE